MPDDQPQYHTGPSACVSLLASVLVLLVIIGISIIVDRYGEAWLGEDINARLAIVETGLKVLVALATALWGFWLLFFLRKRDMVDRDLRNKDADTRNKDADTRNKEAQRENDIVKQRISTEAHQLTMAKGQHEINELRKRIDRQISLSLSIQVDTYIDSKMRTFIATVAITNHGNEATRIVWIKKLQLSPCVPSRSIRRACRRITRAWSSLSWQLETLSKRHGLTPSGRAHQTS